MYDEQKVNVIPTDVYSVSINSQRTGETIATYAVEVCISGFAGFSAPLTNGAWGSLCHLPLLRMAPGGQLHHLPPYEWRPGVLVPLDPLRMAPGGPCNFFSKHEFFNL